MALDAGQRAADRLRGDRPADAPPGHRVGLGDTVDDHAAVAQLRHDDGHGDVARVAVHEVLVDLVGDHPDPGVGGPAADGLDLVGRVHGTGRVGGRGEDQRAGVARAGRLQLLERDAPPRRGGRRHGHDGAARQLDLLGVADPVGRGQQHLVARVDQRLERRVERVLAAVGHHHLGRVAVEAEVAGGLVGDRLAQLRQARGGGVVVQALVGGGLGRGLDDVRGRREVGLARAEADDVLALRAQGTGLGVDRQRRGLGRRLARVRTARRWPHSSVVPGVQRAAQSSPRSWQWARKGFADEGRCR